MRTSWILVAVLAACGGPSSSTLHNAGGGAAGFDVGIALAPVKGDTKVLEGFAVPIEKTTALFATLPEDERNVDTSGIDGDDDPKNDPKLTGYDFDRNGSIDLVSVPEVMFGPSLGYRVYTVVDGKLVKQFAVSGDWADVRVAGKAIVLRFEAMVLAPGEAKFSAVLAFAGGAWSPLFKAYAAEQTKVPAARAPYASFQTVGAAALRAAPVVDDAPKKEGDAAEGGEENYTDTTTLHGNVLATYTAGARGLVLASEGAWRFVAFDPATRPVKTSLGHGMDDEQLPGEDSATGEPDQKLRSTAWLCGWVQAAEIKK